MMSTRNIITILFIIINWYFKKRKTVPFFCFTIYCFSLKTKNVKMLKETFKYNEFYNFNLKIMLVKRNSWWYFLFNIVSRQIIGPRHFLITKIVSMNFLCRFLHGCFNVTVFEIKVVVGNVGRNTTWRDKRQKTFRNFGPHEWDNVQRVASPKWTGNFALT